MNFGVQKVCVFLIFIMLNVTEVYAQQNAFKAPIQQAPSNSTVDQRLGTGFLYSGFQNLKKILPESKQKCAIEVYERVLGLEAYQSVYHMGKTNAGLNSYFNNQLNKSSCMAVVASEFVDSIHDMDLKMPIGNTTNMEEVAGKGRYSSFPPGWAWSHALKTTRGNKDAAMFLIGMCAHEENPTYDYEISGKNKVLLAHKDLAKLKAELDRVKKLSLTIPEGNSLERERVKSYIQRIMSDIEASEYGIQNMNAIQNRMLVCPENTSGFTAPKSLGNDVDISDDLKTKIIKIQRPKGEMIDTLKAKYYHITGSAYIGCQLAKCGFNPDDVAKLERIAAAGYRSVRLCGLVKSNLKNLKNLSKKVGVDENNEKFPDLAKTYLKKEINSLISEQKEVKKESAKLMSQGFVGEEVRRRLQKTRCDGLIMEQDPLLAYLCSTAYFQSNRESVDDNDIDQQVDYLLREYDSSVLYRKWYLGGSVLGVEVPCTSVRIDGPSELTSPNPDCAIKGWSAQRCATAVAKLATWDVDYEWTMAQHEVGARFGASQCQKENSEEPLDKKFCEILKENSEVEENTVGTSKSKGSSNVRGIQ